MFLFRPFVVYPRYHPVQEVVPPRLCSLDSRPIQLEACQVPCQNDCVLSEWSDWSQCSQTCSVGRVVGSRTRFRDVLASAGPGTPSVQPVRVPRRTRAGNSNIDRQRPVRSSRSRPRYFLTSLGLDPVRSHADGGGVGGGVSSRSLQLPDQVESPGGHVTPC